MFGKCCCGVGSGWVDDGVVLVVFEWSGVMKGVLVLVGLGWCFVIVFVDFGVGVVIW